MNFNVDAINVCLILALAAIFEYFSEPSFQPPTAARTFNLGLLCFKAMVRLIRPGKILNFSELKFESYDLQDH